jgi:hypothetical protein
MESGGDRFFSKWYKLGLFNLLLVALIGVLLRYKILASLPVLNHKFFLYAHSHFAFSGWVSLMLMAAIMQQVYNAGYASILPAARKILIAHIISAYGMLLVFPLQGYAPLSVAFSTISIFISYYFVFWVWRFCKIEVWGRFAGVSIKAALIFLLVSSLGAFWLAVLLMGHSNSQSLYFSALYFFLHFQYNGWFFFAIAGLWLCTVETKSIKANRRLQKGIRYLMIACFPAVILSGLWMPLPAWVYWISVAAVFIQLYAVYLITGTFKKFQFPLFSRVSVYGKWLFGISVISFFLRILLQSLSVFPQLGKYAFAYRPVVIGYLHLILIGSISFFLIGYLIDKKLWVPFSIWVKVGVIILIVGFLLTECTLMMQGLGYIGWVSIPYTREMLFFSAVTLFSGILVLFITSVYKRKAPNS